jgi:hypothetical protein
MADLANTQAAPIRILSTEGLKVFEREIAAYRRELPRLLEEGEEGRYALFKGDQLLSVWDTQGDAIQAASERFGLEPHFIMKIDARDGERFNRLFAQLERI